MSKGRVLIAMSGGIDSSVSAMLLLEQGYELMGCTFRSFDVPSSGDEEDKSCGAGHAVEEAHELAQRLGIEHHAIDLRTVFRESVICNFIREYQAGRTPNPCVVCNATIKWGELLKVADLYHCDYIATGHYARIAKRDDHYFLRRAADTHKDQTYFLWKLSEDCLRRTLFPLGDYTKEEVRELARQHGFVRLSEKKESQEICFIPSNDYRQFLEQEGHVVPRGKYLSPDGKVIGQHQGYTSYTIGQRKGLGIALGEPAFVTAINAQTNEVTLGKHDDLLTQDVTLQEAFFRGEIENNILAQIRYRSQPSEAQLVASPLEAAPSASSLRLHFTEPVWAVTPGQSCVIYQGDLLVGGGIIQPVHVQ